MCLLHRSYGLWPVASTCYSRFDAQQNGVCSSVPIIGHHVGSSMICLCRQYRVACAARQRAAPDLDAAGLSGPNSPAPQHPAGSRAREPAVIAMFAATATRSLAPTLPHHNPAGQWPYCPTAPEPQRWPHGQLLDLHFLSTCCVCHSRAGQAMDLRCPMCCESRHRAGQVVA